MGESKVVDEARVICMAADRSSNIKKDTDYVHKGLEHALWNEVKDAETLQEYGESLKSLKGNKAVEMMIKRRARCDKYTIESEDKPVPQPEEENAQVEVEEPVEILEEIPVGALRGEIKLPPLNINPRNNSSLPRPFGADLVDPNSYAQNSWQRVPFSSTRLSGNMENEMESSIMSTVSSAVFYDQNGNQTVRDPKGYKPIAYMNFKPKTKGLIANGGGQDDPYLNNVLGAMATQQAALEEQKNQATAKQLAAEQEAQLRRQKKQEAIDARLYTGVHRMSQISDWQKNAGPSNKHGDFWNAVDVSEQIQAAKQ